MGKSSEFKKPSGNSSVGIFNLPVSASKESIFTKFSKFGKIIGVRTVVHGGRPDYAFVKFSETKEAFAAKKGLDNELFEGRRIKVRWALKPGDKKGFWTPPVD